MVNPAGKGGEDRAERFLRSLGYAMVARNFQTRYGEVDIIASLGEALVIVEVKSRSSGGFGSARSAITPVKLRRLALAAKEFVQLSGWVGPVEFAAVTMDGNLPPELTTGIYLDG